MEDLSKPRLRLFQHLQPGLNAHSGMESIFTTPANGFSPFQDQSSRAMLNLQQPDISNMRSGVDEEDDDNNGGEGESEDNDDHAFRRLSITPTIPPTSKPSPPWMWESLIISCISFNKYYS